MKVLQRIDTIGGNQGNVTDPLEKIAGYRENVFTVSTMRTRGVVVRLWFAL
jgi:hypothetical protein